LKRFDWLNAQKQRKLELRALDAIGQLEHYLCVTGKNVAITNSSMANGDLFREQAPKSSSKELW
jgi:hypothetical protein